MNSLSRLIWALPLVVAVGIGAMLFLRRFVSPTIRARTPQRLVFREKLALSEQTQLHLVEVDGNTFVVLESAQHAALQALSSPTRAPLGVARSHPAWLRRWAGAAG